MVRTIKNGLKKQYLRWFDFFILTVILWGDAIHTSVISYMGLLQDATTLENNLTFSVSDNYSLLVMQAGLLFIAFLYLWFRHFDFKTWKIHLSLKDIGYGILIFFAGSLLFDLYSLLARPLADMLPFPHRIGAFFENETVSTVLYSMLNGIYEEIYFLGICLAVKPKYIKWAVVFSLLVRVSFHLYQGALSALGIGLLYGGFLYLVYSRSKSKNLTLFLPRIYLLTSLGWVFYIIGGDYLYEVFRMWNGNGARNCCRDWTRRGTLVRIYLG